MLRIGRKRGWLRNGSRRETKFTFAEIDKLAPPRHERGSFSPINICRAPEKFRKMNEDAFNPRLVSIGPYHHGESHLKGMEVCKWKCYRRFTATRGAQMELIFDDIIRHKETILNAYEKDFRDITVEEFVIMMMLDAIFILELLSEATSDVKPEGLEYEGTRAIDASAADGKIFEHEWMRNEIMHDMLLLDNQLPWFVLSIFLRHITLDENNHWFDHFSALIKYFKMVGITCPPELILKQTTYSHLVEMLWTTVLPQTSRESHSRSGRPEYIRTASELHEAGVEFISGKGTMTDIHFHDGKLIIPQLTLNEWSETFFRNLIAYEQCQYGVEKYVTSYVIFMDSLIDTAGDVDILAENKIIVNFLIDSQQAADLFNNLHKEILKDKKGFYLAKQCEDLNDYSRNTLHRLKAKWFRAKRTLGRDYFNSAWSIISFCAALFVILLAIVQTVCTLLPLLPSSRKK